MDIDLTVEKAAKFEGFGPDLYMLRWDDWDKWLGAPGRAVYTILINLGAEKGVVPKTVMIYHRTGEDKKHKFNRWERLAEILLG